MGDMLIRDLGDEVMAILNERASRQRRPVEEVARDALTEAVSEDVARRRRHLEEIDRIRAMTLRPLEFDSADLIREDRDSR